MKHGVCLWHSWPDLEPMCTKALLMLTCSSFLTGCMHTCRDASATQGAGMTALQLRLAESERRGAHNRLKLQQVCFCESTASIQEAIDS